MDMLKGCLSQKGLKSTAQREHIAEIFFKSNTHISIDELARKAKRKSSRVNYATVYRTMKLLTECGLAMQRQFGDGQARYENLPEDGHHDHVICIKCSKIAEFKNQKIEELQLDMAQRLGFKVINHKLELYGYCSKCA
ncbi:MAG: transcriptional repressor [Deltaproteobacteria bacterium]|nr:transcriptional repressor [Deltaproteobacteria bacterium]